MVSNVAGRVTTGALVTIVMMIAACGGTANTTAPPARASSSTPAQTPAPAPSAAGCASVNPAAVSAIAIEPTIQTVEIVDVHGTVLNQTPIDLSHNEPVGVGCHGVYLYNQASGDIELLGLSGAPKTVAHAASTPGRPVGVAGAAESPDGARWIYSVTTGEDAAGTVTSTIYSGPIGSATALVTTLSRANIVDNVYGGGYRVLRWDDAGVLLGTDPRNVGGAGPFVQEAYGLASVVRLDPGTGALSKSLDCGGRGRFGDIAPDGTAACTNNSNIVIVRPDGSATTIGNSEGHTGQVAFAGGASSIVWCASSGDGGGWSDSLYQAALTGNAPSRQVVGTADNSLFESGYAFNRVVDDHTIAELTGTVTAASLTLVDLPTGHATKVTPATYIVGVL